MSTPPEFIIVWCHCGAVYKDWWRPSMNLSLDNFDDDYIERASSITCPNCRSYSRMGTLLTRFENDGLSMQFKAGRRRARSSRERQVILYLERPEREQPETLQWTFDWVKQEPQTRVAQLQEIVSLKGEREPDHYGWYEELRLIARVFEPD